MFSTDPNRSHVVDSYQIEIISYPHSQADGFSSNQPLLDELIAGHHSVGLALKLYRELYDASQKQLPFALISRRADKVWLECFSALDSLAPADTETLLLTTSDMQSIALLWHERRLSWIYRTVEVVEGQGIIRIINDDQSNALLIEKPVAINWLDDMGSIGEYYAVSSYSEALRQELTRELNEVLISGPNSAVLESMERFLKLFENGLYSLYLNDVEPYAISDIIFHGDSKKIDYNKNSFAANFSNYNEGVIYLATRSEDSIDQDRVYFYEAMIRKGARPKAIVYIHYLDDDSHSCNYYILDGHHKLLAYTNLKVNPHVVSISRDCYGEESSLEMLTAAYSILNPNAFFNYLRDCSALNLQALLPAEITALLDKLLKSEKNIGTSILKNIRIAYDEPLTLDWAERRLAVLSGNKYIGKGLHLYFQHQWPDENYPTWYRFPINNRGDFAHWKEVSMDGKPLSTAMENKLRTRVSRPNQTKTWDSYDENAFRNLPRTVGSNGFTGREILLLITCFLLLIILFSKGC